MVRWRAVALVLVLSGLAPAEAQDRPGAPVFPAPDRPVAGITSPTYSDEKTRDGHGEAERVMDLLGITPGQRVADIGAGLGYYTVRLARRLGPGATIFATDVKVEYLNRLKARLTRERIAGVRVVLSLPRDPRLPADSVDVALLSHMYHEIENPYEFLYRLRPVLAAGARVGIIDTAPTGFRSRASILAASPDSWTTRPGGMEADHQAGKRVICGSCSSHTEQAAGKGFLTAPTSPVPEMTGGSLGKAPEAISVRILARSSVWVIDWYRKD